MSQIKKRCPEEVQTTIRYFYNPAGPEPDLDDIVDIFARLYGAVPDTFFVIDGLDEMNSAEASAILSTFHNLLQAEHLQKVFIASRDKIGLGVTPDFALRIRLSPEETSEDIKLYIETEISRKLRQERVLTDDPELCAQIKRRLSEEARGM